MEEGTYGSPRLLVVSLVHQPAFERGWLDAALFSLSAVGWGVEKWQRLALFLSLPCSADRGSCHMCPEILLMFVK